MVKTLCVPCFPPHYDIVNKFVYMYHSSLSHHVSICSHCCSLERLKEGRCATEVLSLIFKQGKGAWSRSAAHTQCYTFLAFSLMLKLCYLEVNILCYMEKGWVCRIV